MTPSQHILVEYVGQALGAISMLAGASVWGVVGAMFDWRQARNTPLSKWHPVDQSPQMLRTAFMFMAAAVVLHAGHWALRRWFNRRAAVIGMSNAGWRWLFVGCYAAGFIGGALLFIGIALLE